MKNLPKLIVSVIGCELVGFLGTPFTISAIPTWYATLNKPSFAPPNWIFRPVWTLLYFLMGVAFYLIWKQGLQKKKVKTAGMYFLAQLEKINRKIFSGSENYFFLISEACKLPLINFLMSSRR